MQEFDDGEYDMGVQVQHHSGAQHFAQNDQHLQNSNNVQFFDHQQPQFIEGGNGVNMGFELGGQDMNGLAAPGGEGEEEEESVYIKDNVVMRRIQIEGEEQEYLMDPDGNIYDMQGNFIGTANANELEEMEDDGTGNGGQGQQHMLDEQNLII
jgi:hypothetical protein